MEKLKTVGKIDLKEVGESYHEKEEAQNKLRKSGDLQKIEAFLAQENFLPKVQKYVIWQNNLDIARLMVKYGRKFDKRLNEVIKSRATTEMKTILNNI